VHAKQWAAHPHKEGFVCHKSKVLCIYVAEISAAEDLAFNFMPITVF